MIILGIILIIIGVFMIISPSLIWDLTQSWTTHDGTEPSGLYLLSTRFGGIMMMLVGIASVIAFFFQ